MATVWLIPVVNHAWLEDCFMNWQNLSIMREKYLSFSPTGDFSGPLSGQGIGWRAKGMQSDMWYDTSDRSNRLPANDCNTAPRNMGEMVATKRRPTSAQEPTLAFAL